MAQKRKHKIAARPNRRSGQHLQKKARRSHAVAVDEAALPWATDELGIQSLEGVDVRRDGDKIEYHVPTESVGAETPSTPTLVQKQQQDSDEETEREWDEWNGFSSDDEEGAPDPATVQVEMTESTVQVEMTESTAADSDDQSSVYPDSDPAANGNSSDKAGRRRAMAIAIAAAAAAAAAADVHGEDCAESGDRHDSDSTLAAIVSPTTPAISVDSPVPLTTTTDGSDNQSSDLGEDTGGVARPGSADITAWRPLGLSEPMLAAVSQLGFPNPTVIQRRAVPIALAGRDVIGKAATGSGKTLVFAIPVVERWLGELATKEEHIAQQKEPEPHTPIALILSPTRELAFQIGEHILRLVAGLATPPRICIVTGGLSIHKQERQLKTADIVVGTPGRLWEAIDSINGLLEGLKQVRFLVIDEVDRLLLSEGHFREAEGIIAALDKTISYDRYDYPAFIDTDSDEEIQEPRHKQKRQTLVFSATFDSSLQLRLSGRMRRLPAALRAPATGGSNSDELLDRLIDMLNIRNPLPAFVDANPNSQLPDGLREGVIECDASDKDLYLYAILLMVPSYRTLVFTNSIATVRRLTPLLKLLNVEVHPLHSQMAQVNRLKSIESFVAQREKDRESEVQLDYLHPRRNHHVMIATDVAARGLDIPAVEAVIHYHVPYTAESYVHRSGRTARGDKTGCSIMLYAPEEMGQVVQISHDVHEQIVGPKLAPSPRQLAIDRDLVSRMGERVMLAKQISDTVRAKETGRKEDSWLRAAAEELGIEPDNFTTVPTGWTGRGSGRKRKQEEARATSKLELDHLKNRLKKELMKPINTGVSEKYAAAGRGVDMGALLRGGKGRSGAFLGKVKGLDI